MLYSSAPRAMDASSASIGFSGGNIPGMVTAPSIGIECSGTGSGFSMGRYEGWISIKEGQSILIISKVKSSITAKTIPATTKIMNKRVMITLRLVLIDDVPPRVQLILPLPLLMHQRIFPVLLLGN